MEYEKTLGKLQASGYRSRSVKDELRSNLIKKLRAALRAIRDQETAKLANAVTDAEGPL